MQDATIAILAMGGFGAAYGLLALWQAKAAQRRIASLRAEEAALMALQNAQVAAKDWGAALAAVNSSVLLSEVARKPDYSNLGKVISAMTSPAKSPWNILFSESGYFAVKDKGVGNASRAKGGVE